MTISGTPATTVSTVVVYETPLDPQVLVDAAREASGICPWCYRVPGALVDSDYSKDHCRYHEVEPQFVEGGWDPPCYGAENSEPRAYQDPLVWLWWLTGVGVLCLVGTVLVSCVGP